MQSDVSLQSKEPSSIFLRPATSNVWDRVAIVGATGAVGGEILRVMSDRGCAVRDLRLFASDRSAGNEIATPFGPRKVEAYERVRVEDCDIIFLAVSSEFANVEAEALSRRAIVIDNSSAFRYRPDIPLIVPEINAHEIGSARLIANPNCTTALLALALGPLNRAFGSIE